MDSAQNKGPQKLGTLTESLSALKWIRAWKSCAGPALEKNVQFLGFRKSESAITLLLEVKDPIWRQELEYQKLGILKEYQNSLRVLKVPQIDWPTHVELLANAGSLSPRQTFSSQKRRKK